MYRQTFSVVEAPRLHLWECEGDVAIEGWEGAKVEIRAERDKEAIEVREIADGLEIRSSISFGLRVPRRSVIVVTKVEGDLSAQRLENRLEVKSVQDLALREVEQAVVEECQGDLEASGVAGNLTVGGCSGDVAVKGIEGRLSLGEVGGDLSASDLGGGAVVAGVSGDVSLSTSLAPGKEYRFRAHGDMAVNIVREASARVVVEAPEGDIVHSLEMEVEERSPHRLVARVGEGEALLSLFSAEGDIVIQGPGKGWAARGAEWELERASRKAERKVKRTRRKAERAHRRVREGVVRLDVDRLTRQAEKAAQLGIAQAMEALEKALGRLRRFERVGVAEETEEGAPPEATDEERLAVLKMVERGQITPEEGEMLLDALEG